MEAIAVAVKICNLNEIQFYKISMEMKMKTKTIIKQIPRNHEPYTANILCNLK